MHILPRISHFCAAAYFAAQVSAYFIITNPTDKSPWVNGAANLASWTKGAHDGVTSFDVEMARLSHEGLTFVAKDVPANTPSINLFLQDVPPGDDYFLLFINSTHGVMYATSPRFTILAAGGGTPSPSPDSSAPTITVSGAPNPTLAFTTTFPPTEAGAIGLWTQGWWGVVGATIAGVTGGVWMLS